MSRALEPGPRASSAARYALLALLVAAPSGCSILVSTEGLAGGDAASTTSPGEDSAAPVLDDATAPGDAGGLLMPEPDASRGGLDAGADARPPGEGSADAYVSDAPSDSRAAADTGGEGEAEAGPRDAGVDAGGHARDASTGGCSTDLSNIGTADFHVSFDLRTTASGLVALTNQRAMCSPATFWDIRLASGEVQVETDDVTHYSQLVGTGPDLNDGAPHTVLVARVAGTITITVDGASRGSGGSAASFGALASLATGTDVCETQGGDGTVAFSGTLSSLCVASP